MIHWTRAAQLRGYPEPVRRAIYSWERTRPPTRQRRQRMASAAWRLGKKDLGFLVVAR